MPETIPAVRETSFRVLQSVAYLRNCARYSLGDTPKAARKARWSVVRSPKALCAAISDSGGAFHLPFAQRGLQRLAEIVSDGAAERGAIAAEEPGERGDPGRRTRGVALAEIVPDDVTEPDLVRPLADALLCWFRHRHP